MKTKITYTDIYNYIKAINTSSEDMLPLPEEPNVTHISVDALGQAYIDMVNMGKAEISNPKAPGETYTFDTVMWCGILLVPVRQVAALMGLTVAKAFQKIKKSLNSICLLTNATIADKKTCTLTLNTKNHLHRLAFLPLKDACYMITDFKEVAERIYKSAVLRQGTDEKVSEGDWYKHAYKTPNGALLPYNFSKGWLSSYDRKRARKANYIIDIKKAGWERPHEERKPKDLEERPNKKVSRKRKANKVITQTSGTGNTSKEPICMKKEETTKKEVSPKVSVAVDKETGVVTVHVSSFTKVQIVYGE